MHFLFHFSLDNFHTYFRTFDRAESSTIVRLNPDIQYQSMIGFGGAFTDSTGISILSLSYESQDILIKSYFAPEGIGYNLGRIPIGGSDFSTKPYAYDAVEGDVQLEHFALTQEDLEYKVRWDTVFL